MSPHDPQQVIFYGGMAAAHYLAGCYDEAISSALSVLRYRPTFNGARRLLVAALAQAGRLDEARMELEQLKSFQPDLSIAWIEKNVPYTPGPMAKYLESWRKVGLQKAPGPARMLFERDDQCPNGSNRFFLGFGLFC
jgi:adenylate cyclase